MRPGHLPPPFVGNNVRPSESPRLPQPTLPTEQAQRRRRGAAKDREVDPSPVGSQQGEPPKKERKKRVRRVKEEPPRGEPQPYSALPPHQQAAAFKVDSYRPSKSGSAGSPEPSSNGSGSASRSAQPSPTNSVHLPPARALDEDYDEGVADALMDLASSRPSDPRGFAPPPPSGGYARSPPNNGGRMSATSPHSMAKHPAMMGRGSPPMSSKRPLSPGPEGHPEMKRSRVGSINNPRRVSPPDNIRATPTPSTRPSPIPFRQQPTSHSPETRQPNSYPPSPALPTMLPPHPRPIGVSGGHGPGSMVSLPPLNTRSPPNMDDDRMHSRSASPPIPRGQGKREIVLHPAATSPPVGKATPSPSSSHGSHNSHSKMSLA